MDMGKGASPHKTFENTNGTHETTWVKEEDLTKKGFLSGISMQSVIIISIQQSACTQVPTQSCKLSSYYKGTLDTSSSRSEHVKSQVRTIFMLK